MKSRYTRASLITCLLALLALMAGMAATAHAEGEWVIEGKTMSELKVSTVPFTGELESETALEISGSISKVKVTVKCSKLEVKKGVLLKGGEATGEFLFSSCSTFIGGEESPACSVVEPFVSNQRLLLHLHRNAIYALVDANAASLGTLELGEECGLTETIPLKGSFVFECECGAEHVSSLLDANASVEEMFQGQEEEKQVLPNDEFFFLNTPATWYERWALLLAIAYEGHTWRAAV